MKVLTTMLTTMLVAILAAALAGSIGCSGGTSNDRELERLFAEKDALEAQVRQDALTVERLEAEVNTLLAENIALKDQLETISLELGAENARQPEEPPDAGPASYSDDDARPLPVNAVDEDTGLQVIKASAKPGERNNRWWRFGWIVTVANHSSETRDFTLQVQFMDIDGFVVDDDTVAGLSIPPMESMTFRDSARVDARVARRVKSVNPVIKD